MVRTNNKHQLQIEDIIGALNDGNERYIRMTTSNPAGFNEDAIKKYGNLEVHYTIIGQIQPDSTLLSIKVAGKQYISVPIPPGTDTDRNEQIFREMQETVKDRDPNIGIPINHIIEYNIMDKNEYEKIWKPFLLGDVDNIPKDYFEKNLKEDTA